MRDTMDAVPALTAAAGSVRLGGRDVTGLSLSILQAETIFCPAAISPWAI